MGLRPPPPMVLTVRRLGGQQEQQERSAQGGGGPGRWRHGEARAGQPGACSQSTQEAEVSRGRRGTRAPVILAKRQ